jgi:hypothetical protein
MFSHTCVFSYLASTDTLQRQTTYRVTFVVWTKFILCSGPSNTYIVGLGSVPWIIFSPQQIKWWSLLYVSISVCLLHSIFLWCSSFVYLDPSAQLLNPSIVFLFLSGLYLELKTKEACLNWCHGDVMERMGMFRTYSSDDLCWWLQIRGIIFIVNINFALIMTK